MAECHVANVDVAGSSPASRSMEKKGKFTTYIAERVWGPGDTYLVVPISEIQVFERQGWKRGQAVEVEITIRTIDR